MKKWKKIVVGVSVAVLLGGIIYFKGRRYEVVITQAEIDQALEERFPAKKKHLLIFEATYQNPEVTLLEESDRVRVSLEAGLDFILNDDGKALAGTVALTSGIRYEPETKEFFLDEAVIEEFGIAGIPGAWQRVVTEVLTKFAQEYLEKKPIYRLQAKDMKTAAAAMLLKDFEVREEEIHVTLGL